MSDLGRRDVVVVGGGSAGIAAALAAARAGASTLLVERDAALGGNATQALVHTICGLHLGDRGEPVLAHSGFPREFAESLTRAGGAAPAERAGRVHFLPTRPAVIAEVAFALCRENRRLEVRLGHRLRAARLPEASNDGVELEVESRDGASMLRASFVIDASGEAAVAHLGGAPTDMEPPEQLQFPSYVFHLEGVDTSGIEGFARLQITAGVAKATRDGALSPGCESVVVRSSGEDDGVFVTLNVPKPDDLAYEPLDPDCLATLEERARKSAEAIVEYLKASRPAFREARVDAWPSRIGIRETRRGRGRVVLQREDVLEGRRRDDEVAVSTWPIELWQDHRRARFEHPSGPSSVPLGALVSAAHDRLGFAGRCISATHEALGALRVIGTALATGEAIGVAAALALDAGVALHEVAPAKIRDHIQREARA